jgi:hypothetical protein
LFGLLLILIAGFAYSFHSVQTGFRYKLSLTTAPGVLAPGGAASINFSWAGPTAGEEAFLVVYPPTQSRSQLAQALSQGPGGYPLFISSPKELDRIRSGNGFLLTVTDFSSHLSCVSICQGVYPVEVRVANAQTGTTVGQSIFALPVLPTPVQRLNLLAVSQIRTGASVRVLKQMATELANFAEPLGIAYQADPQVGIGELATIAKQTSSSDHGTVLSPYVPGVAQCPLLQDVFSTQLELGKLVGTGSTGIVSSVNGVSTLRHFNRFSVDKVLVPGTALSSVAPVLSLSDPVSLNGSNLVMLGASATLTRELVQSYNAAGLQRLLADLAQFYLEAPNQSGRIAVFDPVIANLRQAKELLASLSVLHDQSFLTFLGLQQAFSLPPISISARAVATTGKAACDVHAKLFRREVSVVTGFEQSTADSPSQIATLEGLVGIVASRDYPRVTRNEAFKQLQMKVNQLAGAIDLVGSKTLTLTSHQVSVPLSIRSDLPYPIHIKVAIVSSKLSFPRGSTRTIELNHATATAVIPVVAKTLGSFPARVIILSPAGIALKQANILIDSTGLSNVGVAITGLALVVFAGWWIKSGLKARRGRSNEQN